MKKLKKKKKEKKQDQIKCNTSESLVTLSESSMQQEYLSDNKEAIHEFVVKTMIMKAKRITLSLCI